MRKHIEPPEIPPDERTASVKALMDASERLAEWVQQLEETIGQLRDRVNVLALLILDDLQRCRLVIGQILHKGRDLGQAGHDGTAATPLTGDELVAASQDWAHYDRLNDPLLACNFSCTCGGQDLDFA